MKTSVEERRFKIPHIFVLLVAIILCCAIASWILPAGEFERAPNATGRMIVLPNTYHKIESSPVGVFHAIRCIYKGMINGAPIIFFTFIAYASIGLVISSGAFNGLVAKLLKQFKGKARLAIIPIFMLILGIATSTIGVVEETLPFVPIFVSIAIAMGYDAIIGLAIVSVGVCVGLSGAVMNPFTVGMAQSIAEVPHMSGATYRIACHIAMLTVASCYIMRYASKVQADPTKSVVYGQSFEHIAISPESIGAHPFGIREKLVLLTLASGIGIIVFGTMKYHWYFEELAAMFLIIGFISAAIMGWGPSKVAEKMALSCAEVSMACIMIGLARGTLVAMQDGKIIDTVVYGLSIPLSYLPRWLAAEAMLVVQTLLNFLIPSGSGQAVTSMPIMAPLSDLLDISRQVAVLCFQFGDGMSNLLWPTAFAPVFCGIAGVKLNDWWKWFTPLFLLIFATQAVLVAIALLINFH